MSRSILAEKPKQTDRGEGRSLSSAIFQSMYQWANGRDKSREEIMSKVKRIVTINRIRRNSEEVLELQPDGIGLRK